MTQAAPPSFVLRQKQAISPVMPAPQVVAGLLGSWIPCTQLNPFVQRGPSGRGLAIVVMVVVRVVPGGVTVEMAPTHEQALEYWGMSVQRPLR